MGAFFCLELAQTNGRVILKFNGSNNYTLEDATQEKINQELLELYADLISKVYRENRDDMGDMLIKIAEIVVEAMFVDHALLEEKTSDNYLEAVLADLDFVLTKATDDEDMVGEIHSNIAGTTFFQIIGTCAITPTVGLENHQWKSQELCSFWKINRMKMAVDTSHLKPYKGSGGL